MLQQLVNGLILGSIYALLALGYTMVYGIIKLINFAHGDIYMMGAFMGYYLINHLHLNFFLALLIAMLGSALAGAGGVLIGLYYNSVQPLMGVTPGLKAFVAAVLGGIGIIPGAAIGGFVIGILETLATALGVSDFRDGIVYAILILIFLIRPAGILGKNIKEKV
ncbi:TPA: branched-chain amino acid ABC transporter permease [Streptococcus agalactiae]